MQRRDYEKISGAVELGFLDAQRAVVIALDHQIVTVVVAKAAEDFDARATARVGGVRGHDDMVIPVGREDCERDLG